MTQLMPQTGIDVTDRLRALLYGSIEVPGAKLGSMKLTAAGKK